MGKKQETIDMVEVMVGARKVLVPSTIQPQTVREIADIPDDRMLVIQDHGQRQICKEGTPIRVKKGDIFNDIPRYEAGNENIRLQTEVHALRIAYPNVTYDQDNLLWVCVNGFDLPSGLNKRTSDLLIEVPPNYPFGPPQNFFLDRTVKTLSGNSLGHYYPDRANNKYYDKGWAWFCVHIKSWKVKADIAASDSLLTAVDLAYLTLQQMASQN